MKKVLLTGLLLTGLTVTSQVVIPIQQSNLRNTNVSQNQNLTRSTSESSANASVNIERNTALTNEELDYKKQQDYQASLNYTRKLYFERNKLILEYTDTDKNKKRNKKKGKGLNGQSIGGSVLRIATLGPFGLLIPGKNKKNKGNNLLQKINEYNLLLKIELNNVTIIYFD